MTSATPVSSTPTFVYSDFTTVKSRKKKNKYHTTSLSTLLSKLREQLKQDEWFEACSFLLQSSWKQLSDSPKAILCLGLGSPTTSHNARVQLAFLTEICELLQLPTDAVSIYDPVFTPEDVNLLKQLHMKVLTETNAALLRTNSQLSPTYVNSGTTLSNLCLVGNALREYIDNKPKRVMETDFPYVLNIAPYLECIPLPLSSTWPTAFNNTSIQFVRCSSSEPKVNDIVDGNNAVEPGKSGSEVVETDDDGDIRHKRRQCECRNEDNDRLKGGASGGDNYGTYAPLGETNMLPDEGRADRGEDITEGVDQGLNVPDAPPAPTVQGKIAASSGLQQQHHESKREQSPERERRAKSVKEENRERGDENGNEEGNSKLEGNMPSEISRNHGESLSAVLARLRSL